MPSYQPVPNDDADNDDIAAAAEAANSSTIDHEAIGSTALRKIDLRLISLLFITYNLNFIDKTILGSAAVFGLGKDTVCTNF